MNPLETLVCGVRMKNPLLLASAPTTGRASLIKKALETGVGGVVAKSVSARPEHRHALRPMFTILHRKGYPTSFSNYSSGFASLLTPDEWKREMSIAKECTIDHDAVLIGSIFSANDLEEWAELARMNEDLGADLLELDLSCPSTTGTASFVAARDGESAYGIVDAVVRAVDIPVFAKLSAEAISPVEIAGSCKEAGASGITALNRFSSLDIDITTGRPLLGGGFAGVGGPWMRPIMLKWVARLVSEVGLPVSATNGIWSSGDVIKAIMCGATTAQTCTAVMYGGEGFDIMRRFLDEMLDYVEKAGISSLDGIRGITLPQIRSADLVETKPKGAVWAKVNPELCRGCRRPACVQSCFHDALSIDDDGRATILPDACEGCGLCVVMCPRGAIHLEGEGPFYLGDFS